MLQEDPKEKEQPKPYPSRQDWKRILGRELIEFERQERERRAMRQQFPIAS